MRNEVISEIRKYLEEMVAKYNGNEKNKVGYRKRKSKKNNRKCF